MRRGIIDRPVGEITFPVGFGAPFHQPDRVFGELPSGFQDFRYLIHFKAFVVKRRGLSGRRRRARDDFHTNTRDKVEKRRTESDGQNRSVVDDCKRDLTVTRFGCCYHETGT